MRRHVSLLIGVLLAAGVCSARAQNADPLSDLNGLAIELLPGSGRPYLFSGTGASFFYGTTETMARDGWMGYHVGGVKLLSDVYVTVNGQLMDRAAARVTVLPHQVTFRWPGEVVWTVSAVGVLRDDLRFTLETPDSEDTKGLFLAFNPAHQVTPMARRLNSAPQLFMIATGPDTLGCALVSPGDTRTVTMSPRGGGAPAPLAAPPNRILQGVMVERGALDVAFVPGMTPRDIMNNADVLLRTDFEPGRERQRWLAANVRAMDFTCADPRAMKAVRWAAASMAQLFAENDSLIWAGLPWFSEGWGRDTFISLPGATLVTGKFEAAERILRRFARWQDRDPGSPTFGRIPNRARAGEVIYNTADGTPWFIRELFEYGLYSGDRSLWREMMAEGGVVETAIEGVMGRALGEDGLFRHGPAETWMDAVGPRGPWSPRGDRAVEIQALWMSALEAAARMEEEVARLEQRDTRDTARRWRKAAARTRDALNDRYVRGDGFGLFDHLDASGGPDRKIRPNQLFAVTLPLGLQPRALWTDDVVTTVHDSLLYPWGIASLAPADEDFHPFHETFHYPKDAAYHNGIVWTWLSGPWRSAASLTATPEAPRAGFAVLDSEVEQILDWGLPGSLSENLDAVPRDDAHRPRTSGTVTQAWSLAEFLRSVQQDYLGLRSAHDPQRNLWTLDPRLPMPWGDAAATVHLGGVPVRYEAQVTADSLHITLRRMAPADDTTRVWIQPFGRSLPPTSSWRPRALILSPQVPVVTLALERVPANPYAVRFTHGGMTFAGFTDADLDAPFLPPVVPAGNKALRPPAWTMLDDALVGTRGETAPVVIDVEDPSGDDTGPDGDFGYPTAPEFADGILDLTRVTVRADEALAYITLRFRNLVDPGWHPEYGFQLTFATLAIRTGDTERERTREVGRNSGWTLPRRAAADRLIHVGGGFRVLDGSGEVLAEHIPREPRVRMGDVDSRTVRLALPRDLIGGEPEEWRITVLVGAQDDHGGAGIGEFRAVTAEGGPWQGFGGGPDEANVYDTLEIGFD